MTDTNNAKQYDEQFFAHQVDGSIRSASQLVPMILELHGSARSVIDVGCGTGSWLSQYAANGIEDYLGVDGFLPSEEMLRVPAERTESHDLRLPLELGRRFDVVQSMEVAEHLPAEAAETFVKTLTSLGDFIVFGAAVPGQGGTHHINEQWQSYWVAQFREQGYVPLDILRHHVWYETGVEWWYTQNTIIYVNTQNPNLLREVRNRASEMTPILDVVHPACFRQYRDALDKANQNRDALEKTNQNRDALENVNNVENQHALLAVLPHRFKSLQRAHKLINEQKPWYSVAFRHPLRVSLWWDLYRVQRRRAREIERSKE